MTTGVAVRPVPVRSGSTLALAWFEARRTLRHPFTVIAAVLYVAPWIHQWLTGSAAVRYPVLQDADRATQIGATFLLGSAAMLTANLAVLRDHRHGTGHVMQVLLLPRAQRATAALLSVFATGVLAAVLVGLRAVLLAAAPASAGRLDPYELAAGPVAVIMLGALGVLLGLTIATTVAAPFALAAVAAATIAFALPGVDSTVRWLLPVALEDLTALPMPAHLLGRPAAAHLGYLVAITLLFGSLALMRAGMRVAPAVAAAVAVALATATSVVQLRPVDDRIVAARLTATDHPASVQICERRTAAVYCAFPDFRTWIGAWDEVVTQVARRVPEHRSLVVRQRVFAAGRLNGASGIVPQAPLAQWQADDEQAGTPDAIDVGTSWGTGQPEFELAAGTARQLVAGPAREGDITMVCGGRSVLILWLAGQASPAAHRALDGMSTNGSGAAVATPADFGTGTAFNRRDVRVALNLLDRPVDAVAGTVTQQWATLTDAGTSTEAAARILGVPGPTEPLAEGSRC